MGLLFSTEWCWTLVPIIMIIIGAPPGDVLEDISREVYRSGTTQGLC